MLSVIVPFRNRFEHLNIFAPIIKQHFASRSIPMRLVIVEQNDNDGFRRGALINIGVFKEIDSRLVIAHDVDYTPSNNVEYYDGVSDVFLPVKYVEFIHTDGTLCDQSEVSKGYQHYSRRFGGNGVDDNFWGAVNTFKRHIFMQTSFDNGHKYWGFEECAVRERCVSNKLTITRSQTNVFNVLNHDNNAPAPHDVRLQYNMDRSSNWKNYLDNNVNTIKAKMIDIESKHPLVDRWILATEFDGPTHIQTSKMPWD